MKNKIKVYFNLRKSSRERMWDTAKYAASVCEPIFPGAKQQTSLARAESYKNTKLSIIRKSKHVFKNLFPIINHQNIDVEAANADLLYMWGAFPKNSTKHFVIELDNPFVLSYYNQRAFTLRLNTIRRKLLQAKAITFLSKTAMNHTIELVGKEIEDKCCALPPFMENNFLKNNRKKDGTVNFLFVGLGFRRKGGLELLDAFSKLPDGNARLTVVTPLNDIDIKKYKIDTRITFLPPQPREVLFNEIYPTSDVFVFPSMLETLGVVILEALSYGMGIITTDSYATPEMVKNGYNGKVLKHPFLNKTKLNGIEVIDCITPPREKFQKEFLGDGTIYQSMSDELFLALKEAILHHEDWQKNSEQHFSNTYAPDKWESMLSEVLN